MISHWELQEKIEDELKLIMSDNYNFELYVAWFKTKCIICGSREHQWKYGDKIHGNI